jgi:hypothetical protein
MSEINPIRAPIFSKIPHPLLKKPVNPSFSVRVENTSNYSPVCQNEAFLHLARWPPKPLKSNCFLPPPLPTGTHKPCQNTDMKVIIRELFLFSIFTCFRPFERSFASQQVLLAIILSPNIAPDSQMDKEYGDFQNNSSFFAELVSKSLPERENGA